VHKTTGKVMAEKEAVEKRNNQVMTSSPSIKPWPEDLLMKTVHMKL
jgi:hypothetical protein